MQLLTVAALFTTAAFASPIAQQQYTPNNTPPAVATPPAVGTPVGTPVATPYATPYATPAASAPAGGSGNLPTCGAYVYDPRAFYCHNEQAYTPGDAVSNVGGAMNVLCPIQNGRALSACGRQCYDPEIFSCGADGTLSVGGGNGTVVATPTPAGVYPPAGATPTGYR